MRPPCCRCNLNCCAGGESPKEKGAQAVGPRYSTQASAAADGRDLGDEPDVEKGLPQRAGLDQPDKAANMKTLSLSQVDAPTLAEFEVGAHAGLRHSSFSATDH